MKVMAQDVIVVRHPEFGRLRHQLAIATERFNHATNEKHGFLDLFGSLKTITPEDLKAFLEQIEAEQEAYDVIKGLHDKVLHLLREENQAKAATTSLR
jgi:transcriptional regulator of NAD metabolism